MANWKYTLDVKDLWEDHGNELISDQELCTLLAGRIRQLERKLSRVDTFPSTKDELLIIADNFEYLQNFEDFDDLLDDLYDWADYDHICWVKTF